LSLLSIDCDIVLLFSQEWFVKKEVKELQSLELAIGNGQATNRTQSATLKSDFPECRRGPPRVKTTPKRQCALGQLPGTEVPCQPLPSHPVLSCLYVFLSVSFLSSGSGQPLPLLRSFFGPGSRHGYWQQIFCRMRTAICEIRGWRGPTWWRIHSLGSHI